MVAQTLAHYKILEKIGSGGRGDVYLAEDTKLDHPSTPRPGAIHAQNPHLMNQTQLVISKFSFSC